MKWPLQSEADAFYGNPRGRDGGESLAWIRTNMVRIVPPFKITFGGKPMTAIPIHRKCADSALRVLYRTWELCGRHQPEIERLKINQFSGSRYFRPIRDGHRLSMHAYGCAWDWDAPDNMLGDQTPFFGYDHPLVKAHLEEGWIWGADWDGDHNIFDSKPVDGMHFQAARVYAN
jgi:hypothetical protein